MNHFNKNQNGFTLIEVMIVLAIVAAIITMALSRFDNQASQLKSVVRRFSSLSRELKNRARLDNAIYRIAFDLSEGSESQDAKQMYWVEKSGSKFFVPKNNEDLLKEENTDDSSEEKAPNPNGFEFDETLFKEKMNLPSSLVIEDIEIDGMDRPIKQGMVYIHFFPEGLVQESAIHFKAGENMRWTISIHPITAKSEISTKYISLKDIREQ